MPKLVHESRKRYQFTESTTGRSTVFNMALTPQAQRYLLGLQEAYDSHPAELRVRRERSAKPKVNTKHLVNVKELQLQRGTFQLTVKDLNLKQGKITCIVGANGSGKTTLLEIIVGLINPPRGKVLIDGRTVTLDAINAKKHIGYIPDDDNWVIAELTASEYFALLSDVYRKAGLRIDFESAIEPLARTLLFKDFNKQLGTLSHGNKRKVQIIAGLMHKPQVLVVDELRNGLDPVAIRRAEAVLKEYCDQGGTVFAATHDLWWAERFADEVIMVREGKIVLHDKKQSIVNASGSLEQAFIDMYQVEYE